MTGNTPRKRPSPAVYRRRRLVLLLAVVAVVALVWLLIAQPWAGAATRNDTDPAAKATQAAATDLPVPGATTAGTDAGAATATGTPATPGDIPAAQACIANDIAVEALADSESYGTGQNPQFSIRLTNHGDVDCSLNVGTSGQVFTVTSGDDVWWRSTDCQSEPSDMVVLLAAGQSVTSAAPLTWDRTRSAVGTCNDPARQAAPGGGASYYLNVEIGGIASTQQTLFLLY